ncbi:hypothetical protein IE4872_CH00482 [Rhizobium gallicum]|uniref:Uncharacterized protein n=1 Tax=Rhizobium gallicum TaxID=56730 RepID=A0A1L5NE20_9HYPH|nr:hypothetical protein [Rhizobium gallicum]APO66147.1 hypothetical protein IE4872_CH00482 [Rhizobium gallicum]
MTKDQPSTNTILALGLLKQFPPSVRVDVARTPEFRSRYGQHFDVRFGFGDNDLSVQRSVLYSALRALYTDKSASVSIKTADGKDAVLSIAAGEDAPTVTMGERRIQIPPFGLLSPDADIRNKSFDAETASANLEPEEIAAWRKKIDEGALSDDEIDELDDDLKLMPQEMPNTIRTEFSKSEGSISALVPNSTKYYSRLIGHRGDAIDIESYARGGAAENIKRLLDRGFFIGLAQCILFCAGPQLTRIVDLSGQTAEGVEKFFKWVAARGDRWSQIAAVEVGLRALSTYPSLEPILIDLLEAMRDEDTSTTSSRFRLTASLFIFTDGELSRVGTFEGQPPFWRRLAATAQAGLIERELIRADGEVDPELWMSLRSEDFYMQTLADLRMEPRWLPDLMNPKQLRMEFLMRARIVADEVKDRLPDGRLRELLLGSGPGSLAQHTPMPSAYIPNPIEGASVAPLPFPEEMIVDLKEPKDDKPLEAKVFASVVNLALVFRLTPEIAALIAGILRKVKYRLTLGADSGVSFSLLSGLAVVAAATRSAELADELRILTRVFRRRGEVTKESVAQMRIALIACSSRAELEPWCQAVGDWMLEIANDDIDRQDAIELRSHLTKLCKIEPTLWRYAAKAEAALATLSK